MLKVVGTITLSTTVCDRFIVFVLCSASGIIHNFQKTILNAEILYYITKQPFAHFSMEWLNNLIFS